MSKIINKWFTQNDIIQHIDNHINFSEKYTKIYESTDNAFEHFIYYSIPIPAKKIHVRMNSESWGSDIYLTRKRILSLTKRHYLSVNFRRYFNISLYSTKYCSESNEIYGNMDIEINSWSKSKKCYVLTDALTEYLQCTNQMLIFGIRSHRYSERELKEYKLKSIGETYKSYTKNYSLWFREVTEKSPMLHSQIKSFSVVFGKYFVSN